MWHKKHEDHARVKLYIYSYLKHIICGVQDEKGRLDIWQDILREEALQREGYDSVI